MPVDYLSYLSFLLLCCSLQLLLICSLINFVHKGFPAMCSPILSLMSNLLVCLLLPHACILVFDPTWSVLFSCSHFAFHRALSVLPILALDSFGFLISHKFLCLFVIAMKMPIYPHSFKAFKHR